MVAAAAQSQAFVASKVASRRSRAPRVVRAVCVQQGAAKAPAAPLRSFLAAGLAAAAIALTPAADAKVILVQPEVKNFVTNTAPAPSTPEEKKARAAAAPKQAKVQEEGSGPSGFAFEFFRPAVLPVSLVLIAGAGFAAVKVDPEFAKLFNDGWGAKDSGVLGFGYETTPGLKDSPFYGGSNTSGVGAGAKKSGTVSKKVAGTVKIAKKAGAPASKPAFKLPKLF